MAHELKFAAECMRCFSVIIYVQQVTDSTGHLVKGEDIEVLVSGGIQDGKLQVLSTEDMDGNAVFLKDSDMAAARDILYDYLVEVGEV